MPSDTTELDIAPALLRGVLIRQGEHVGRKCDYIDTILDIRRNSDGLMRRDPKSWEWCGSFIWADGNYACDCNRYPVLSERSRTIWMTTIIPVGMTAIQCVLLLLRLAW